MTSFTSADESRYTTALPLAGPRAGEDRAGTSSPGRGHQGGAEVEQVSGRRHDPPTAHEALDVAGPAHGNQQGDRTPPSGDFHRLTGLDLSQVPAGLLSQLPDA